MESSKCENNTIEHNKNVLNLIIKEFRELIGLYSFKTNKKTVKILRKAIRNREKLFMMKKKMILSTLRTKLMN